LNNFNPALSSNLRRPT